MPVTPSCPRCDYDLSGETSRWTGPPPQAGTCPECGLTFEWIDVLDPDRKAVPGFVEHSRGRWATFKAAWKTVVLALLPWVFWKQVRMESPLRPRRWIAFLIIVICFPRLVTGGADVVSTFACMSVMGLPPFGSGTNAWQFILASLNTIFSPIVHVDTQGTVWGLQVSGVFAIPGRMTQSPLGPISNGAPSWVYLRALDWPGPMLAAAALSIVIPFTLFCLPYTRKVAKVRAAHIGRAAVFGLCWLAVPILLDLTGSLVAAIKAVWSVAATFDTDSVIRAWEDPGRRWGNSWSWVEKVGGTMHSHPMLWSSVLCGWLFAWWFGAIRSWRLRNQREVLFWLAIIALLTVATCVLPKTLWR